MVAVQNRTENDSLSHRARVSGMGRPFDDDAQVPSARAAHFRQQTEINYSDDDKRRNKVHSKDCNGTGMTFHSRWKCKTKKSTQA